MAEQLQIAAPRFRGPFLVDAHVHLHDCFEPARFLDAAWANLRRAGAELRAGASAPLGCLLLADLAGTRSFPRLQADASVGCRGQLERTDDGLSLVAFHEGLPRLILLAGRQIATAEGLEVLALGAAAAIPDRLPLEATLPAVRAAGGLAVLPWGVGKWWGARGRLVDSVIACAQPGSLCLGDNGNRPQGWPSPRPFARAAARGIGILPGSDPLALPREVERVGSYGCILDGEIERARPGGGLLALLRAADAQLRTFGTLQELPRFGLNQLVMHWRKRRAA